MAEKAQGCATCRHAEWERTANGRLHPSGQGRCTFMPPDTPMPRVRHERSYRGDTALTTLHQLLARHLHGGWIWRKSDDAIRPCPTWEAKP